MNENNHETTAASSKAALNKLIRNHMIASAGAGLIPVPFADLAALTGVQLNLVRKIADTYNVPFSEHKATSFISALVAGAVPVYAAPSVSSLIKLIPIVGTAVGLATTPLLCAASTYAVGQIFVQHFESGGTLSSFDTATAMKGFKGLFKKGQDIAVDVVAKAPPQESPAEESAEEQPVKATGKSGSSQKKKRSQ